MCGSCLMIARINRTNSMCVALDFVMFNFLEKTTNFAQLLQKNEGLARFRGVLSPWVLLNCELFLNN